MFHRAAAAALVLLVPVLALAQSTALLRGTVTDPSGAVVPGADVVCRNQDTGREVRTVTTAAGLFQFPDLPVGPYELKLSREGFRTLVRGGIDLLTGQTADLALTLEVGGASQSVEVTAPAPLVQSTSSELQTTVDSRQMADLPLNGRNAFELAVLTAGAVETEAGTVPGQQDNNGLAVNGLRATQNNWELDGGTYTNRQFGSAPTLPNPDTLQEFTARTSNFTAESKGAGAVVKLTTRSGTNRFSGTLFHFLRNEAIDARNFFSLRPEPYKHNQYGATLGGPIRKNKLFFFASFQGTNKRGDPSPRTLTVPTAAQHNGDFTQTGKTIVDPLTQQPFPGNTIPRSRFDSIGTALLAFVPLPNNGPNGLLMSPPTSKDDYQGMIKLDWLAGNGDQISGRYFDDRNSGQRDVSSLPGFFGRNAFSNQTLLVSHTRSFGPAWLLRTSFNYLRTYRTESPETRTTMQALGAKAPLAGESVPDKINVNLSGYTRLFTARGIMFHPAVTEVQSDVSRASGKHLLRFGGSFRRNVQYAINRGDDRGAWTFSAQRTNSAAIRNSGDAIAGLLLGLPASFNEDSTAPERFLSTVFDAWVQDDWRVLRRLTLNLGVRWDPWLPARDTLGPIPGFLPGARSALAPLAPAGLLFSGDPGMPASVLPRNLKTPAPRFGFAWDVFGRGSTVVRGGYGIYRPSGEFFGQLRQIANNTPMRSASVSITAPPSTADPFAGYTGKIPFPFRPLSPNEMASYVFPANMALRAFDPKSRSGYTQTWNLTVERQLARGTALSVSYVGNHYIAAMTRYDANPAIYGPGATLNNTNARRLYPGFAGITLGGSIADGYYHGLQTQLTRRTAHGLTVLANYTWSKAIDIDSAGDFGGAGGDGPRSRFNFAMDQAPADFDVQHQAKLTLVYDLPVLRAAPRPVRAAVNGWQVNGILLARTGFPCTCRSGVDNSLSAAGNDTCDQITADTARPAGADPLQMWFNTAAFIENAIGAFGASGRNSLRRPGLLNLNLSVFRRIPIKEKLRAEIRVEAFNALNHANFDLFFNPNGYTASVNRTSPTFGKVTHARDPRLMQVALKLRF